MANNRMYLICNVCVPEGANWPSPHSGLIFHVAKWDPSGFVETPMLDLPAAPIQKGNAAYYTNQGNDEHKIDYVNRLDEFLANHEHREFASENYSAGAGQPNPVRLEYESVDLPVVK
jgi:hypothetical protein